MRPPRPDASGRPWIIAHRGGDGGPANSIQAAAAAIALGVDAVEFDLRHTADGRAVAWHDPVLPSGRPLGITTLAAARAEVPHLATAAELAALCGQAGVGLLVDLKEEGGERAAGAVGRVAAAFGAGPLWASSQSAAVVGAVARALPGVSAGLSLGGRRAGFGALAAVTDLRGWGRAAAAGATFVALRHHLAAAGALEQARRRGLMALVWTVDAPRPMARLLGHPALGGLITNRPAHALAVRAARPSGAEPT